MSRYQELPLTVLFVLVSLPFQLLVAINLFFQLGSPLMFRQVRAGQGGQEIVVSKFRTMNDLRDSSGNLLADELRQTGFTRLVRRLRLDELPQLWLVLARDMALVGPRPLLPKTLAEFGELGKLRNSVPPGLTGWAQVNGNTRLSNDEKLAMDLWYVAHRSFRLDLRVLFETFLVPLRGEVRDDRRLKIATNWMQSRYGALPGVAK